MDMKLEVVVTPVSDVDRAKNFYTTLGWRLDADFAGLSPRRHRSTRVGPGAERPQLCLVRVVQRP
jgi:catechol 2,3-dioxygenase-like lactoylglutathione lyase family enzyme